VSPYDSGNNVFQYTVTPVPEPGMLSLAAIGLAGICLFRRSSK
jgi:hypothetical protein